MARAPEYDDPKKDGKVPATEARQGVSNQGVRYVLGISLVLVIVAFILAYLFIR